MSVIAGIDNGYDATKSIINEKYLYFKSKIEYGKPIIKGSGIQIEINGKEYIVGEGVNNFSLDKTDNELHQICTYTALAKNCPDYKNEFDVVLGYPLNIYSANKEKYADIYLTGEYVKVKLEGQEKLIKINKCKVFPQCAGAIYATPMIFKNRLVGILDIGGLTVNGCIVDNLNIIKDSIFTENLGGFILKNSIKKLLNSIYTLNIQDYNVDYIIKYGLKTDSNSKAYIDGVMEEHMEKIISIMRQNNWNEEMDIFVIGGGSLLLQDQIKKMLPNAIISEDPINTYVKGLYNVGRMMFRYDL
jgi:plasmid segregation protein ParM